MTRKRPAGRRTGRRPSGGPSTRVAILHAARDLVLREGPRGVSVRDVAHRARVDPALIYRYFESKEQLFIDALRESFTIIRDDSGRESGPFDGLGEKVVFRFLRTWGRPSAAPTVVSLLRAASEDRAIERQLREYIQGTIIPATREHVGDAARTRAPLVGCLLLGVGVMRYLLRIEPLASMSEAEVARLVGPYVTDVLRGTHDSLPDP